MNSPMSHLSHQTRKNKLNKNWKIYSFSRVIHAGPSLQSRQRKTNKKAKLSAHKSNKLARTISLSKYSIWWAAQKSLTLHTWMTRSSSNILMACAKTITSLPIWIACYKIHHLRPGSCSKKCLPLISWNGWRQKIYCSIRYFKILEIPLILSTAAIKSVWNLTKWQAIMLRPTRTTRISIQASLICRKWFREKQRKFVKWTNDQII